MTEQDAESIIRAQIDRILRQLTDQLFEVVNTILTQKRGQEWDSSFSFNLSELRRDTGTLIRFVVSNDNWHEHFALVLGTQSRALLFELRDWRNRLAHNGSLDKSDIGRVADTGRRLFAQFSKHDEAAFVRALQSIVTNIDHSNSIPSGDISYDSGRDAELSAVIHRYLSEHEPATARDIAQAINCQRSAVNRELYRLEGHLFVKTNDSTPVWSTTRN